MPAPVMIVQILTAERRPEDALADQGLGPVFEMGGRALILEASGGARHQPDRPVGRTWQQRAGIRRDRPVVERGHHGTPFDACKTEAIRAALRRRRGGLLNRPKLLRHNNSRRSRPPGTCLL